MLKRRGRLGKRNRSWSKSSFNKGYNHGYDRGHVDGYQLGLEMGASSFSAPFEGTSIIIPSFNQRGYLQDCLESIRTFTPEPHEIIVVDNGSNDGTKPYLQSLGRTVRFKASPSNLGFAGGVNQGLMMARGSTLLLLNNDTIVTENWLSNLLACLHSDAGIGLVGPVTNYISGDQLIETSYTSVSEMHDFARSFNCRDPGRYRTTKRLTGFCVLMRRELFRRLGYFDEGFEVGNCEDDDFGLRAKLLGLRLVIAGDTFIHHAGSKTVKSLTPGQLEEVYGRNLAFFSNKWGDPNRLQEEVSQAGDDAPLSMTDYYPTHVVVQGAGSRLFWVEHGVRYPLEDAADVRATRLSKIDLWNWPVGAPLSREQFHNKLAALSSAVSHDGSLAEGAVVTTGDGKTYQHEQGKLRRIATEWALRSWNLDQRSMAVLPEAEINRYRIGRPILAPPVIRADNL